MATTMPSRLSCGSSKITKKNYSPFLLEAAAAVWGMETFILFTDHKPLETLAHKNNKSTPSSFVGAQFL
jgi:hypothetical protein